ncbi:MAG TPA: hypothetical protein VK116_12065, partial [Planctomycetota bacterium]|nr:hypothetical protein [Planctomycetota bacterium]
SMDLPHPETGETIPADAGEPELPWLRAQTVGEHVAAEVLRLLETDGGPDLDSLRLHVRAKTIFIGLENPVFRIAAKLGRLDRGSFDGRLRTEVSVIDLGPFRLVGVPGEIYPEIVYGGIETPPGADFAVEPVEVPPIAEALAAPGIEQVLVIGLANDEVGYLIPKSEWDAPILPWDSDGAPPYLYNAEKPPYGEINSCGPNAAKTVHEAILSLPK